jgi:hypothetical protein
VALVARNAQLDRRRGEHEAVREQGLIDVVLVGKAAADLLPHYRQRGTAEGHFGELMDAIRPALSSNKRPKSHYRGRRLPQEKRKNHVLTAESKARESLENVGLGHRLKRVLVASSACLEYGICSAMQTAPTTREPFRYRRHEPEKTLLYRTLAREWETWHAERQADTYTLYCQLANPAALLRRPCRSSSQSRQYKQI